MHRLSDGRDLVSLGQVAPDLHVLSEDRLLWKKLCQYHFSERQVRAARVASGLLLLCGPLPKHEI
jgi:F-box protein 25/32